MRSWTLLAAALALVACGEGESSDPPARPPSQVPPAAAPAPESAAPPGPQTPPARPVLADGAALFRARCATCHGEAGDGNG